MNKIHTQLYMSGVASPQHTSASDSVQIHVYKCIMYMYVASFPGSTPQLCDKSWEVEPGNEATCMHK